MKNVAKCDTWCELQNPVNHRVFERKLRPKPFGRGHACLGVTYRVAPPHSPSRACAAEAEIGLPCFATDGLNASLGVTKGHDKRWLILSRPLLRCARPCPHELSIPDASFLMALASRPQVRRDYPLSLSISISGGKETYKDSLSNGERTGISPA